MCWVRSKSLLVALLSVLAYYNGLLWHGSDAEKSHSWWTRITECLTFVLILIFVTACEGLHLESCRLCSVAEGLIDLVPMLEWGPFALPIWASLQSTTKQGFIWSWHALRSLLENPSIDHALTSNTISFFFICERRRRIFLQQTLSMNVSGRFLGRLCIRNFNC